MEGNVLHAKETPHCPLWTQLITTLKSFTIIPWLGIMTFRGGLMPPESRDEGGVAE
jgi:hypothetical protein